MPPPDKYPPALLVYNAATEYLHGTIPGHDPFMWRAFSGGSRGHRELKPKEAALATLYLYDQANLLSSHYANTPELKNAKGDYIQRGGTLPAGHYTCEYQAKSRVGTDVVHLDAQEDARAIYSPFSPLPIPLGAINPDTNQYERRGGFYIHGAGVKGSDGCIVLPNAKNRLALSFAVRDYCKNGGKITLLVKNVSYILPAELAGSAFA